MTMTAKRILSEIVNLERFGFPSHFKLISEDIIIIAEPSRAFVECFCIFW